MRFAGHLTKEEYEAIADEAHKVDVAVIGGTTNVDMAIQAVEHSAEQMRRMKLSGNCTISTKEVTPYTLRH